MLWSNWLDLSIARTNSIDCKYWMNSPIYFVLGRTWPGLSLTQVGSHLPTCNVHVVKIHVFLAIIWPILSASTFVCLFGSWIFMCYFGQWVKVKYRVGPMNRNVFIIICYLVPGQTFLNFLTLIKSWRFLLRIYTAAQKYLHMHHGTLFVTINYREPIDRCVIKYNGRF